MDDSDDDYVDDAVTVVQPRKRHTRRNAQDQASYSWEDEYHRSWDVVQEEPSGSLAGVVAGMVESTKKRRAMHDTRPVRRGIIRNLVLILDMSFAMTETDMRPTRQQLMLTYAMDFVSEYFNQNPISQLAIVIMREGVAKLASPLDGNPHAHLEALQSLRKIEAAGLPSLQNALEMAQAVLFHVPPHNTKEVLLVFGALLSNDPGDINKTISTLIEQHVRVHIIGLAAQVAICSRIAQDTNFGDTKAYTVVLNEGHFRSLFAAITTPLAVSKFAAKNTSALVEMGFPRRLAETVPSLCACHARLTKLAYICPRCDSKVCTLPMVCPVCNLTLVLSTHLARSYHHLFPLKNWNAVENDPASQCFACLLTFGQASKFQCPLCLNVFCIDCDVFCHETLHNCPGCEAQSTSTLALHDNRTTATA